MKRNSITIAVLAALIGFGAPALAAGDSPTTVPAPAKAQKAGEAVALTVTVIEMSNGAAKVDPKLKHLSKHFARSFKNYKTFRHVASHSLRLTQGKAGAQTVRGKKLEAEYLGRDKNKVMRVQVKFDGARMTMKVRDGGLWFHAGRRGKGGSVTVLALRARLK